jgi:hypothetical protein
VSTGLGEAGSETVVQGFHFGGSEVVDAFVGTFGVEPPNPLQGGFLDVGECLPWPFGVDELGLVAADLGLG